MLSVVVAWSSTDDSVVHYVLPVLWMTACYHMMAPIQIQAIGELFTATHQVAPRMKFALCSCLVIAGVAAWLSGRRVGLDQQSYSTSARLVLGWVTICGRVNHIGLQPVTRANSAFYPQRDGMSTSQNVVTLCCWEVKAGMFHSTCG